MPEDQWMRHRGQWPSEDGEAEQVIPNSFETLRRSYKVAVECDVVGLADGTLAVMHPGDFKMTDAQVESLTAEQFEQLRIPQPTLEAHGGPAPSLREFLAASYDRGLALMIEIKGSTPEGAGRTMLRTIEEINSMRADGIFDQGTTPMPEYTEQRIFLTCFSGAVLEQAQAKMQQKPAEKRIPLGLQWSSTPEWGRRNPFSRIEVERFEQAGGTDWEQFGIDRAVQLGCKTIDFIPTDKVTTELIQYAHDRDIKVHVGKINDRNKAQEFLDRGVDMVIYGP